MVHSVEQPSFDTKQEAQKTLERLLPRLSEQFIEFKNSQPENWVQYEKRIQENFDPLFEILVDLYGTRYDFFFYLESLLTEITAAWIERPDALKKLDSLREAQPEWFQDHHMLGGVCYVDLFAENLSGIWVVYSILNF